MPDGNSMLIRPDTSVDGGGGKAAIGGPGAVIRTSAKSGSAAIGAIPVNSPDIACRRQV